MSPDQLSFQEGRCRPRPASPSTVSSGGLFPLHKLPSICCSSGACREVDYWPMVAPQDGWLQLEEAGDASIAVDLFAFSSRGVGVILTAEAGLRQGRRALLLLQAHGGGISHRPVRCCWHRAHPSDPALQCAGLMFDFDRQG